MMVYEAFKEKVGERIGDYSSRARTGNPPKWFPESVIAGIEVNLTQFNFVHFLLSKDL